MKRLHPNHPNTTIPMPPATRGRLWAVLLSTMSLLLPLIVCAGEPENDPSKAPYAPYQEQRHQGHPYQHGDQRGFQHPSVHPGTRAWTGLRLETGTSVSLVFGNDPYHDGATLAAIVHGLETGESLLIERTETGVRLRRHGGRPGGSYDFLDPGSGPPSERP